MKMYAFPSNNAVSIVAFKKDQPLCVITLSHDVYKPYYSVWSEAFTSEESDNIEKLFAEGQMIKAIGALYAADKVNEGASVTDIGDFDELKKALPVYIRSEANDIFTVL